MGQIVKAPLQGEILGPDDEFDVVVADRVMAGSTKRLKLPAGTSVAEAVLVAAGEMGHERVSARDLAVDLGGHAIPRELWEKIRVKAGATLVVRAVPRKSLGNIFRQIFQIGLMILGLVLMPYLTPLIGALGASLVVAGITLAGGFLVNLLFPPQTPKLEDASQKATTYSIGGGRNEANRFGPVPVLLGKHRIQPKYGATPYTEFVGNDQYLRVLFIWGYGPMKLSQFKIGETDLSDFDDVEVYHREGYASDPKPKLVPKEVVQQDLSVTLNVDAGWQVRTTAAETNEISIDIQAPNGLMKINSKGDKYSITTVIEVQYKLTSSGTWISRPDINLSGKSDKAIRRGYKWDVTEGQYDVRVRRITPDFVNDDGNQFVDGTVWSALRSIRNDASLAFPKPVAYTEMRIRATDQLNGVIDNFNGVGEARMKSWNGTSWVADQESRNPADIFRFVLQHPANARPLSDSRIDLVTLQAWAEYCSSQGYKYDYYHDTTRSVRETLAMVASAGRAIVLMRDGKWSVAYDEQNPPTVQHFTPRNSWNFSGKRVYQRMPHAFRVRFINSAKGWLEDERIVYADGYNSSNATKFEQVEFPGTTEGAYIHRHARYQMAQAILRPEKYHITTDIEHLICNRGDRVRLTHDVPKLGLKFGRVRSVSGSTVELDEPVDMASSGDYVIRFRLDDGTSFVRAVATSPGTTGTVVLEGSGSDPEEGCLFAFGEAGQESIVCRVYSITPGSQDFTADLVLVDDAPEISDADTEEIPEYDSNISQPVDVGAISPNRLRVDEFAELVLGKVRTTVTLNWYVPEMPDVSRFEVQYLDTDVAGAKWTRMGFADSPEGFLTVYDFPVGPYQFRVRAQSRDTGKWSKYSAPLSYNVLGAGRVPQAPSNFRVNIVGDQATFTWNRSNDALISHYVIRYSPTLSSTLTWGQGTVLVDNVQGQSALVPIKRGTYMLKAVSYRGIESATHQIIVNENGGLATLNVVQTIADTTFAGTKTQTQITGGFLRLAQSTDAQHVYTEGFYELPGYTDLSEVYVSRLTAGVTITGEDLQNVMAGWTTLAQVTALSGTDPSEYSVEIQMATTLDNPAGTPTWSAWEPISLGDVKARAFKFRLRLSTQRDTVTPRVSRVDISIDMPDRIISGKDVAVGTGGLTITFSPKFKSLKSLVITGQGLATGDYYTITSKSETGFTVIFRNSAGTAVARTMDYTAVGYGRVTT